MKLHNLNDVLIPRPKVQYYIEGMIRPASVNMFYGESGLGKTFALVHQGIHLATGSKWLGFETMKVNVLFIQEEMGDEGFYDFLEMAYRGYSNKKIDNINFDFMVMEGVNFDNGGKWEEKLKQIIEKKNINVAYLDPFASLMTGDENTKKDVQPMMDKIRALTKLPSKPAFIILHHPNRGAEGSYRGSGAIKGNLDLMVQVKAKGDECITFKMEKNRYRANIIWTARKCFEGSTYKLERFQELLDADGKKKLMISTVEMNPSLGVEGLERAYVNSGGKRSDARPLINELTDQEVIEPVGDGNGGRGKRKTFKLTEAYLHLQMEEGLTELVSSFK